MSALTLAAEPTPNNVRTSAGRPRSRPFGSDPIGSSPLRLKRRLLIVSSQRRRGNIRTWLLLVLALVPTSAVLVSGVWLWSSRGEDLRSAESSVIPIDTTFELFSVSSSIQRLDTALTAAAMEGASDELVQLAEDELERTQALLASSPAIIESQIARLSDLGQDTESNAVLDVIADAFRLASGIVSNQVAGQSPSIEMRFLITMSRDNAGGLVLPYIGSGTQDIAFLYETIATAIDYHNAFDSDRRLVVNQLVSGTASFPMPDLVDAPVRNAVWKDLIDSRQFTVAGIGEIPWELSERDPENPLFLLRDEPLSSIVAAAETPTSLEERNETLLALLSIDQSLLTDVETAYSAVQDIAAGQIRAIERERTLTAAASILVSIVGLLLLGLTVTEVRQRRSVERAHDAAIMLLADKAQRDPTTGAWNRRRLEDTLGDLLLSVEKTSESVVLAYIDLDSFKAVNDVWGHHTGDHVLRIVTDRLSGFKHDGCVFELIRFGGDEFVLYAIVDSPDVAWLEAVGAAVLSVLDDPMSVSGREHSVSASVGVTMSDKDSSHDSLLLEADSSLILAKSAKRGTAIVYNREISRTGELVHALPKALASGEITCHLQPVYDMRTGTVCHAEALARWFRPNGESVSPAVFVPLVESFGLAEQLTGTMLRSVAKILRDPATPSSARIWVNLSPRELEIANFATRFAGIVASLDVDPTRLGLEITETAAVRDPAALAVELGLLRKTGVAVAIDDFGNGYSPLGFLRDLPVDVVKLDRSLIADIDTDRGNQHLVTGVVGMLGELGMNITAEGVERVEEESWLVDHGVYSIQGFLRGRPVGPDVFNWFDKVPLPTDAELSRKTSLA